jgi:hypothetical protein
MKIQLSAKELAAFKDAMFKINEKILNLTNG